MDKLKILMAASEVVPFAKTGGLADVTGALPKALKALGHDVRIVMPRYYAIDKNSFKALDGALGVDMGREGEAWALVLEGMLPDSDIPVYFIDHEAYFGRSGLYEEGGEAYADNYQRFVFFSKAVMQLSKKLHFKPDIIHVNDWHTALIPLLLNTMYAHDSDFENTASVLTIHNLQHQGRFSKDVMEVLGIGWQNFNIYELEDYDGVNLLKGGIVHTDALTTVSPKYSLEIRGPEFDWGLKNVINAHANKLHGILNGIDYDEWNPANDKYIAKNYDLNDLSGKKICKKELQKIFNLPQREDVALIGFVGRLVEQKGISLIAQEIYRLMDLDIQIVLLGAGEKWAEDFFSHISDIHRNKFACYIGYRNDLAHKIEAGSDFFLMPSLFEPCGLNQLYSLSYATLPIVRATGGLDDTIQNYDSLENSGTGFKFYEASGEALYGTIVWAVDIWYNNKDAINMLIQNGMKKHFGWDDTAMVYESVYYQALLHRRNRKKG
ncbi:glycogen synthase [Sulfurimonas sp. CS5]|uniref:glycogen synthase n=1 Tax=Sulfurimonas sp. CS5 TaxID=3391145 RepID=UPI0039ED57F6